MFSLRNLFCVLVIVNVAHQNTWALIGDNCTGSCEGGMVCDSGRCACPRDHVPNADKSRCLIVAANVGAGCEIQEQCTKVSESICLDFKCTCKENAAIVNNVCEKRRELGEHCNNKEQCQHINDASCTLSVCACNENFVPRSDNTQKCLPIATSFQSPCEEDIQCSKGFGDKAFCRDSKCQCTEGFHGSNMFTSRCVENKGLSDTCSPGECFLPMDGDNQNIECLEQKCKCKNDVAPSQDNDSCSGSAGLRSLSLLSIVCLLVMGVSRNFV